MKSVRSITAVLGCVALACALMLAGCGKTANTSEDAQDLASIAASCSDVCNTMLACIQEVTEEDFSDEEIQASLTECNTDCNDPGDMADERACALACDQSTDCQTYLDCLCNCEPGVTEGCA